MAQQPKIPWGPAPCPFDSERRRQQNQGLSLMASLKGKPFFSEM
jgi:hypothetical protein